MYSFLFHKLQWLIIQINQVKSLQILNFRLILSLGILLVSTQISIIVIKTAFRGYQNKKLRLKPVLLYSWGRRPKLTNCY